MNPEGFPELSERSLSAGRTLDIYGAPEGQRMVLVSRLAREGRNPVMFVATDDREVAAARDALGFLDPGLRTLTIPAWDCPPYSRISPNPEIQAARISALTGTARGTVDRPDVVLTTVNSVMQRVPGRSQLLVGSREITSGHRINYQDFLCFLEQSGYTGCARVGVPGEFAVRGGIIDVFPGGFAQPVRFDFFGDLVDGIRSFDQHSQRTIGKINSIRIDTVSEVVLNQASISRFRRSFRAEFGVPGGTDDIYAAVSSGQRIQGIEHWLPLFHDGLETLLDYFPEATVCLEDSAWTAFGARWKQVQESYDLRRNPVAGQRFGRGAAYPCRPESLYLEPTELQQRLEEFPVGRFHSGISPDPARHLDVGGRRGREFSAERHLAAEPLLKTVADHLNSVSAAVPVVVACWSRGSRERLGLMLRDVGVRTTQLESLASIPKTPGIVGLAIWELTAGFSSPGLTVVSEQDLFGRRLVHRYRRRSKEGLLGSEASSLVPGDLVVHVEHGIGKFIGLETIEAADSLHDCLVLEYRKGDRLYLPTVNINLLSRFGEEGASLDRLGGVHWQERKARLKKEVLRLAEQLLAVAAKRKMQDAVRMSVDGTDWNDFLARFQFVETDDQRTAADEVLEDLASGRPMDRLICGDVGFGKTEIAMRAAFTAAMSGSQVAVVAPTTLLVRQHFENFAARFRNFPLRIEQVSRLIDPKLVRRTRRGLEEGSVDIAIGTHALLGKSVKFRNLGLVIVDEEQAFGVMQKERLKEMRSSAHVLALTATPIPRTLKLALSGARDLSLIGTPPADRLAVRTFVLEFDPATVREALLQEKFRHGQSFFVVPRIGEMPEFEAFLTDHVPEVSFVSAHGRLGSQELERRTNAFYDGEYDVLLSTTIIAAGLDIPTANTIVIVRAERFGLAQLHQIRGRVGRSRTRAYAYITYMPGTRLGERALQRLEVLRTTDSLGSGFTLAAQDLDIRGAGNLLGPEQSGHVREVGYELYQRMLESAIAALKSGSGGGTDVDEEWAPQLNLGITALIPSGYVDNLELRLGLYRRMSSLSEPEELEALATELIDRFGALPEEVEMLLATLKIKQFCRRANISRLDAGPKGVTIRFRKNEFPNPEALFRYLEAQRGRARMSGPRLAIRRNWFDDRGRIAGVSAIARDIARLVNRGAPEGKPAPDAVN